MHGETASCLDKPTPGAVWIAFFESVELSADVGINDDGPVEEVASVLDLECPGVLLGFGERGDLAVRVFC